MFLVHGSLEASCRGMIRTERRMNRKNTGQVIYQVFVVDGSLQVRHQVLIANVYHICIASGRAIVRTVRLQRTDGENVFQVMQCQAIGCTGGVRPLT